MIKIFSFSTASALALVVLARLPFYGAFVLPTGQFCPHRSEAWYTYMDHLEAVSQAHQQIRAAVGEPSTSNNKKKKDDLVAASKRITSRVAVFLGEWERLIHFRDASNDYQLKEYCAEPHLFHNQLSDMEEALVLTCRSLVNQQAQPNKKTSDTVDILDRLARHATAVGLDQVPQDISAGPFLPEVFQSQCREAQLEVLELLDDHKEIIENGFGFGALDSNKQERYLVSLKEIEDRWEVAFHRFKLMDGVNPEYVTQCQLWLAEVGLNEGEYKELHAKSLSLGTPKTILLPQQQATVLQPYARYENAFQ